MGKFIVSKAKHAMLVSPPNQSDTPKCIIVTSLLDAWVSQSKWSGWKVETWEFWVSEVMNMNGMIQEVQVETGKDKVIVEGVVDQKGVSEAKEGEDLYGF